MFYGVYPPWAICLIVLAVLALIAFVVCLIVAIFRTVEVYKKTWRLYPIAAFLLIIGATSIVFASIQAYSSQVTLYNLTVDQKLAHVDSINGVFGSLHAYNTTGNCYVYANYDSYQKAMVLDGRQLRNSTLSLNGTTVYGLTTKPLTQAGIDQLCSANYGEDAFNNTKNNPFAVRAVRGFKQS